MASKIRTILAIILSLFPLFAYSKKTTGSEACIFLGSKPSLIIKFKNISSKEQPVLEPSFVQNLSSINAVFTTSRAMSGNAYIIFFSPKEPLLSEQIFPGCFSQMSIETIKRGIEQKTNVEYIVPNILMKVAGTKSLHIPIIGPKQWNLLSPPGGIDAQTAFNVTTGNPNVITAVLDSGILPNDSLTPNLLEGVTFNNSGLYSTGAAPSCDSCEDTIHGTHVSGIIAASGTFAYGESIFGVAPTTKILPINVNTKFNEPSICNSQGRTTPCLLSYTSDQINALNWLNGDSFIGLRNARYVSMINMSLGRSGPCDIPTQLAMISLFAKNISIAVAAGNANVDAINTSPANCTGVMAVAATGPNGYGASYSNYGNIISFAAPGGDETTSISQQIYSTVANDYGYLQGTSMASPHVAGLGALLYSLDPTLTPNSLLNIIKKTTTDFPSGGPDKCTIPNHCGTGIINANSAVIATVNQAPILSWNPNLAVTINTTTQVILNWNPAMWVPPRLTGIVYTVNINGVNVSYCQGISATSCVVNNLDPSSIYIAYVQATDVRAIHVPSQSASIQFKTFEYTGPILTVSSRNPLRTTQAYIYFSSLGNAQADTFTLNGLPTSASLALDASKSRFIVSNITTPKQIDNVTITANFGGHLVNSNSISIPSIL